MHFHKYEKIWLTVGIVSLALFLKIVGINAFSNDHHHPTGGLEQIDPQFVDITPPFDDPGVRKIDENTYEVNIVALAYGYEPQQIEIPANKNIIFNVTSKDVTHSFSIPQTNVNMMVVPGHISTKTYTFSEPGNYLVICNEYCGLGHEYMMTEIEVVAQ